MVVGLTSSIALNMNYMDEAFAAEPSMMMGEKSQVALSNLSSISETLAANSGDFGGMAAPIIGLGLLSAIIALLAGPIED